MTPLDYAKQITPDRVEQDRVSQIIKRALADEDCRLASLIDDAFLTLKIDFANQAAKLCRDEAMRHGVT